MRLLLLRLVPVLLLIGGITNSYAQTKFYTQLSEPKVIAGQSFQVRYIVEGAVEIGQMKLPAYPGFQVMNIYEVPSSQKIDPATQQSVSVYSKVVVLSALEGGTQIIKGAIAQIDGKTLRSNNLRVDIGLQGTPTDETGVEDASEILEGETIEQKLNDNFFLLAQVNKKTCYVGEPIYAEIKACSRLNATSQVTRRPSFTGFSVIEMVDNYDKAPTIENIDGQNFFVHLIRKVQLLPLQPGKYVIDHAEVESTVRFLVPDTDMDFEEVLKGKPELKTVARDVTLRSPAININVMPLPDTGQPANFNGAVGRFSILASVKEREIAEGSSGILKIIIRGNGNLPLITAPEIPSTDKFRIINASAKEYIDPYKFPVDGYKEFEYQVTPKGKGNIQLPAISFAYFDPSTKEYVTEHTNPIYFYVSDKKNAVGEKSNNTIGVPDKKSGARKELVAFAFIALAIIGWVTYQFLTGRKKKFEEPKPVEQLKTVEIIDPFTNAEMAMKEGNKTKFLQEIQRLLITGISNRYGLGKPDFNRPTFIQALKIKGAPEDIIQRTDQLLADCEWNLYAPGREVDMEEIMKEAKQLI